jgi:hypothetical protein
MKKIIAYISTFLFLAFLMAEGDTLKHIAIQGLILTITGTYLVNYANRRAI